MIGDGEALDVFVAKMNRKGGVAADPNRPKDGVYPDRDRSEHATEARWYGFGKARPIGHTARADIDAMHDAGGGAFGLFGPMGPCARDFARDPVRLVTCPECGADVGKLCVEGHASDRRAPARSEYHEARIEREARGTEAVRRFGRLVLQALV